MKKIQELKIVLKNLAEKIKKERIELKAKQRAGDMDCWKLQWAQRDDAHSFRHHHIAYCELRGRTRDQIEQPKEGHEACENTINNLKLKYAWEIPELDKAAGAE